MNTKPSHGPIHFHVPAKILWRTIRGMISHKTKRGALALGRLKAYEGVSPPYDKKNEETGYSGCSKGIEAATWTQVLLARKALSRGWMELC
ncbi:hypothetical protein ZOSMA_146G00880 [Zostera marina]|uniref:60S ribosomal protein L13a n=1 Tax=Zostera marina TaxID=29655 RepID=A0A0K9PXA1_ZOSMR|nr:hypothetical protein ZOSMA_146G00880 [Zostera marina]